MKDKLKEIFHLLKRSVVKYKEDNPIQLAGTTAYFTIFAMAPIIIIVISIAGILLGQETIHDKIFAELHELIGDQGTGYVKELVGNYRDIQKSVLGTVIGFGIFIFASSTFFTVLQRSINHVWRIKLKPSRSLLTTLRNRLLSFGLVISLAFIMLVSLLVDVVISFIRDYLSGIMPWLTAILVKSGNLILGFGIIMVIFALIFKFLPDVRIEWKVTWIGAFTTTLLFMGGKFLIGLFLGNSNIGLMYGAAGSLVIVLIWVFYSSIIFFFGVEITQQYAEMYGHEIKPKQYAYRVEYKNANENN